MTSPDSTRPPSSWREGFAPTQTGTFEKVEITENVESQNAYCEAIAVSDTCKTASKQVQQAALEVLEEVPYPEFLYGDFYFKFREALKNHPAIVEPDPYFGPLKAFIPGYGVNTLAIGHNGYIRMQKERQEDEIVHLIEPDEDFDQIYFTEEGLEALGWDSEKVPKRNLLIRRARVSGVDLTTNERIKEIIENEPYLGAETFSKNNPCTPTPADSLQDPTQPLPWRVHKTHN